MDLREELRNATRPCHAEVERLFEPVDIGTGSGLRRFLLAHYAAVAPIEHRLERIVDGPQAGCWPFRLSALLDDDLTSLGVRERPTVMRADLADAHPLGLCYVLGGSRLGARLLLRRLSETTGSSTFRPRYLTSAPDDAIWAHTRSLLAAAGDAGGNRQAIGDAAELAFSSFADALALVEDIRETDDALAV